jgi:hypothetical protein
MNGKGPMTSADATEIIGLTYEIFVVPLLFHKGSLGVLDLKGRAFGYDFSSSAFDLASKGNVTKNTELNWIN